MGRRAYFSDHRIDRLTAVALTLGLFAAQWYRFVNFRFTTYDLGVFHQVLWKMANGQGTVSTLTSWDTFADHLSPVLFLFVPLYWVASSPLWFFAAQALALGGAVLCVRPLAHAVGVEKAAVGTTLVVAYALQPAIWNAAINAFHPTALAVPFLLIGCIAGLKQQYRVLWLTFFVLIFLRDDLALAFVPVALVGWRAADSHGRRLRAAMVLAGFAWTIFGSKLGESMGASRHFVYRYGYLGDSMTDAATQPVQALVSLAQHFLTMDTLWFGLAVTLPLALLPMVRPAWFAMAAFVAVPSLVADDPFLHSPAFHYGAPIVPFLMLAASGALAQAKEIAVRRVAFAVVPLSAVALAVVGPPMTNIFEPANFEPADARAAIATIDASEAVVASDNLGAYVAERDQLKPYPWPFVDQKAKFPLDPDVTDASPQAQEAIDVVIIPKATYSAATRAKFLAAPEIEQHFETQDFGTVVVLRRVTP